MSGIIGEDIGPDSFERMGDRDSHRVRRRGRIVAARQRSRTFGGQKATRK